MSHQHPVCSDEFCDRPGAEKLKAKIEAYWRARGYEVQVDIFDKGFHPTIRAARYDVRSTLVNGLPRPLVFQNKGAA